MSKPDLSPVPAWSTVWPTQLRMLSQLQKRDYLVLAGLVVVLSALGIWGILHVPQQRDGSSETLLMFAPLTIPFGLLAAYWPLGVWRQDPPERRGYFWSLPTPRAPHTLVRVVAGWVTLMASCVVMMAVTWALLLFAARRIGPPDVSMTVARWYVPVATATLAYLLTSSLAVLFDTPVRTLAWVAVTIFGLRLVAQVAQIKALALPIDAFATSLGLALAGPIAPHEGLEVTVRGTAHTAALGLWGLHYLGWLAVGAVGVVLASLRYRDARS